jgi:MFS superfamily sulfate permease-like transporter
MDRIKKFAGDHPQITSWILLAIGMVIILVWSAREVGFTPSQWTALVITTILLAGACVWIIGWEDDEDEELVEQVKVEAETNETSQ